LTGDGCFDRGAQSWRAIGLPVLRTSPPPAGLPPPQPASEVTKHALTAKLDALIEAAPEAPEAPEADQDQDEDEDEDADEAEEDEEEEEEEAAAPASARAARAAARDKRAHASAGGARRRTVRAN
jgi:hypothetical protein